ncbi:hypothetical protein I79_006171 [Cricetulus griseus]|uniref:Uncharacterized protein n=1 Tax=Cricetulus griseus TaxID=10029 RepID=G3H745_CRIGR|nr:hypothetical protein I79_006171 [Cricetulus griseus]
MKISWLQYPGNERLLTAVNQELLFFLSTYPHKVLFTTLHIKHIHSYMEKSVS